MQVNTFMVDGGLDGRKKACCRERRHKSFTTPLLGDWLDVQLPSFLTQLINTWRYLCKSVWNEDEKSQSNANIQQEDSQYEPMTRAVLI